MSFQWWKDGEALTEDTGPSLTLTSLRGPDSGRYSVTVCNLYGAVTSALTTLTVIDPLIKRHPVNQHLDVGQSVT